MKIIISPAKKMRVDTDSFAVSGMPEFLKDACILMKKIRSFSFAEVRELWRCNDRIAKLNYDRFQHMELEQGLTPAVMAYDGLQYQHMAPGVFTADALSYLAEHLRILSGFYGLLGPFDGVVPYRLEMQAKLSVNGYEDLYDFWGNRLYQTLLDEDRVIVNLASREYAQCIEKYVTSKDRFLTIVFGELTDGKLKQKGTIAKMARGEMVRFMAEHQVCSLAQIKEFRELGFSFSEELSNEGKYVFVVERQGSLHTKL